MGEETSELKIYYRQMTKDDLPAIARIHKKAWKEDHFSSKLNENLLIEYYNYLLKENKYCFVAETTDQKIAGFVAGGENTAKSVKRFTDDYLLKILFILLRNPGFIINKVISYLKMKRNPGKQFSRAKIRLMSIAVHPSYNNLGIGAGLMNFFEKAVKDDNINLIGLSVKKSNTKAIDLYNRLNWRIEKEEPRAIYYIKELML